MEVDIHYESFTGYGFHGHEASIRSYVSRQALQKKMTSVSEINVGQWVILHVYVIKRNKGHRRRSDRITWGAII